MRRDACNLATSTDRDAAAAAFKRAAYGLAAHRPFTGAALASALVADPDRVAAHAPTGFANLTLARSEPAAATLAPARSALAAGMAAPRTSACLSRRPS